MQIELRLKPAENLLVPTYSASEDDVRSILMDVCRELGAESEVLVSGFGQPRWPVDARTDLPIFLEQLPFALRAVQEGRDAVIDFYEQGIERSILIEPSPPMYRVTCSSRTAWEPSPAFVEMPKDALESMLLSARNSFMRTLAASSPELVSHPWIEEWLSGST